MSAVMEFVEEHKFLIGGLALGGIVLVVVVKSVGGDSQAAADTSGQVDPNTLAQLAAQQSQTEASLSANSANLAAQQQLATTQAQYGIDVAQISANAQTQQNNTSASVALAQIAASAQTSQLGIAASLQENAQNNSVTVTGIEAQLAGLESNNQTTLGIAQTSAAEQTQIAQYNSVTQQQLGQDSLLLGLAQTQSATQIATTASNNAVKQSGIGAGAGIAAGLIGALL
jgi:hypothetical protein